MAIRPILMGQDNPPAAGNPMPRKEDPTYPFGLNQIAPLPAVGSLTRSCTAMKWDYHYPRGPRSCPSYVVSSRHHLIDLMHPTRGHIAISPHGGL
jgi:hypothetical protein